MLTSRNKFIVVGSLILICVVGILLFDHHLAKKADAFSRVTQNLSEIRGDMLMLRRNEKDFLVRLDTKYEQQFSDNLTQLLKNTDELHTAVKVVGLDKALL